MKKLLLTLLLLGAASPAIHAVDPSGTLPVMYINTKNSQAVDSKDTYVSATYWIDPKNSSAEAVASEAEPAALKIKGRGNYTWTGFDKKPYRLKLDSKTSLLGMNKDKNWALMAHADDKSMLRTAIGMQLSRTIGMPWTSGEEPLEVVLNGDYLGLYYLTENVKVGSKRVNVWDYDSEKEDWEALAENAGQSFPWSDAYRTGGWLVEIDNYDDDAQIKLTSKDGGETLRVTYDTPADYVTDSHLRYLREQFEEMDKRIYEGSTSDCTWSEMIDITDAARFFLVNAMTDNYEAYHGSCKLWKEQDGLESKKGAFASDGKWHFGPVWDFGSSFLRDDNSELFFNGVWYNHWAARMYEYPAFKAELLRVYKEWMEAEDGFTTIFDYIDAKASAISAAAKKDHERWSSQNYGTSNVTSQATKLKKMLRSQVTLYNEALGYSGADIPEPVEGKQIYLRGDFDGNFWGVADDKLFSTVDGNVYTLSGIDFSGSEEFKLATEDWTTVDLGKPDGVDQIELDRTYTLVEKAGNMKTSGAMSNVTLRLDLAKKELTVTNATSTVEIPVEESATQVRWFNLQGQELPAPTPGLPLIRLTPQGAKKVIINN